MKLEKIETKYCKGEEMRKLLSELLILRSQFNYRSKIEYIFNSRSKELDRVS
jgi:hypothetical protein